MTFLDHDTTEAHERRIARCRACRARIIWFKTDRGKNIPVDADTVEPTDQEYSWTRHVAHFATCTDPGRFRKPRA